MAAVGRATATVLETYSPPCPVAFVPSQVGGGRPAWRPAAQQAAEDWSCRQTAPTWPQSFLWSRAPMRSWCCTPHRPRPAQTCRWAAGGHGAAPCCLPRLTLRCPTQEGLEARGFRVKRLDTYDTRPVPGLAPAALEAARAAAVVAIASPSALKAWMGFVGAQHAAATSVACIGAPPLGQASCADSSIYKQLRAGSAQAGRRRGRRPSWASPGCTSPSSPAWLAWPAPYRRPWQQPRVPELVDAGCLVLSKHTAPLPRAKQP